MPFTQDTTTKQTNKSVCNGCDEHCKLGAFPYTSTTSMSILNFSVFSDYYWPTIGDTIIKSYTAADGTTVSNRRVAKTKSQAIQLAREISKLCANYKTK